MDLSINTCGFLVINVNLNSDSCDSQKKRFEELETAVEDLTRLLRESSEQYGALEKAKQRAEEDAQKELDKERLIMKELKEENEKINEASFRKFDQRSRSSVRSSIQRRV